MFPFIEKLNTLSKCLIFAKHSLLSKEGRLVNLDGVQVLLYVKLLYIGEGSMRRK